MTNQYKIFFSDIGGVLLSNGWGHESRMAAAEKYHINYEEMDMLHDFIFNVYEMGKDHIGCISRYRCVQCEKRFLREEFKEFMFASSIELPEYVAVAY